MRFFIATVIFCASLTSHAATSVMEVTADSDSNWFGSGFSLSSLESEALQDGGARFTMYNYASLNYRMTDRTHWAFRVPFVYQSAGYDSFNENENQKQSIDLADLLVDYTISRALLPGEIEVFTRIRGELPTSKYSRAQRKIGGLKLDVIASRNITNRIEIEWWPSVTWNIHTQTVYENPDLNNALSHTKRYELDQRLTLWYRAHRKFSVGAFVGTEDTWFNESEANNTGRQRTGRLAEHLIKVGPAVQYTLNDNFRFIFNVSNSVPMWGYTADRTGQSSDLGRFRPEQTGFALLTFISI